MWAFLSALCNILRLAKLAEYCWQQHKAKLQAQSIANTPTTDEEWHDAGQKGDL